jgi:hypothetical protein
MRNTNAKWRQNEKTKRWHKARVPGSPRQSRIYGGNGFRGSPSVRRAQIRIMQSRITKEKQAEAAQ